MFYQNFVRLCNKRNISPSAAAEDMGFHRSDVTRWSKGSQPRQATLQKIADYFGVPVSELTAEKEKSPRQKEGGDESDLLNEIVSAVRKADHDTQMDIYEMIKIIMKREK